MDAGSELVGRDVELDAQAQFLEAVERWPAGRLMTGAPGIGKTSLLRAGIERADGSGYRVLTSRPSETERALSFAGLSDLFGTVAPELLAGLIGPRRSALEAALLLSETPAAADPRAIGLGVLDMLRELARNGPVLLALDDLHWLDQPTAAALAFALRRLQGEEIGLLATCRPDEADYSVAELVSALGTGRIERAVIGPLSMGATHRVIVNRLGRGLPRPLLVRVREVSGGNPLYALELARAIMSQPVKPGHPLPIPTNLTALMSARMAALPQVARRVLPVVAALAEPDLATVERALDEGEATAGVESAEAAGVLTVDTERLRFTHPLMPSVLLSELPRRRVRELHRAIAGAVRDPEQRAHHAALAAEGPDPMVAEALDAAAAQAAKRGAPAVAAEFAEQAARLTPADDRQSQVTRLIAAAGHLVTAGDLDRSRQVAERLLRGSLTPRETADLYMLLADTSPSIARALDYAVQAAAVPQTDRRRSSWIQRRIALFRVLTGDVAGALDNAKRALELAEHGTDPYSLARALALVAAGEMATGRMTPGLLERGVALEASLPEDAGRPLLYSSPSFVQYARLVFLGQLDEARASLQHGFARADAIGDEGAKRAILHHLTELELLAGDWKVARQYASEGMAIAEQLGLEHQGGATHASTALVDAHQGRLEDARAAAERGLSLSERAGDTVFAAQNRALLGFIELSRGDAAAADRWLRPLAHEQMAQGTLERQGDMVLVFPVMPHAIEALIALGEHREADRLLLALEMGAAIVSPWVSSTAGRCRGLLVAAQGEVSSAIFRLQQAVEVHRTIPGPFELARTLLVLGTCQRRGKQKAAARRSLSEALRIFETLGATVWAERARGEIARIGGRPSAGRALTPTEERVAALVAEGRTNREAAGMLFLSEHTVEGHLTRIYAKLGVRSRAELAHRLVEHEADTRHR